MIIKTPSRLTVILLTAVLLLTGMNVYQARVIAGQHKVIVAMYKDLITSYGLLKRCVGAMDNSTIRASR